MASQKCALPSCDSDSSGPAKQYVDLTTSESEVLMLRFGNDMKCLCGPHYNDQFKKYISWHNKKCSDPCVTHKKLKKTRLSVISLDTAKSIQKNTDYRVIPGQSLCHECRKFLMELVTEAENQGAEEERGCFSGDLPIQEDSP